MAEDAESRLLRIEERTARTEQRVEDLAATMRQVTPLIRELGEVAAELRSVRTDVGECRDSIGEARRELALDITAVRQALEDRDTRATDERKAVRIALIGLTGVIGAALIAGLATVLVTVLAG